MPSPALPDRIGDLNATRLLPMIERVFDEFDRPDEIIRISRLNLDLGHFRHDQLGRIEERLAAALRDALRKEVPQRTPAAKGAGGPEQFARPGVVTLGVGPALVETLEHYLLHGFWPYGAALDASVAPADLLALLVDTEPARLVAMLRRRAGSDPLLRRLVRQMPVQVLERLLHRLDPAHAAYVIQYVDEATASHAADPQIEETPDEFAEIVWTIVLRDALHSAGLRANRRAFVRSLVEGLAEARGIAFAALRAQLQRSLDALPAAGRGPDSLLSILEELGHEAAPPRRGATATNAPAGVRSDGARATAPLAGFPHDGARAVGVSAPDIAAADPLERLQMVIDGQRAAGESASPEPLLTALAAARGADRPATGLLLRRLLSADPAVLLESLRPALRAPELLCALLPDAIADALAAIADAAAASDEERALLVGIAAAAPSGTLPAAMAERVLAALAGRRGIDGEALRKGLIDAALQSGGLRGRGLAAILGALQSGAADREKHRAARRAHVLDSLRALLGALPPKIGPAELARRLPSLTGMDAATLRRHLGGASLARDKASARLERLGTAALIRLVVLLAPRHGRDAAMLRRRLSGRMDASALAEIAADLIATGTLGRGAEPAPHDGAREDTSGPGKAEASTGAAAAAKALRDRPLDADRLLARLREAAGEEGRASGFDDPVATSLLFDAQPPEEREAGLALLTLLGGAAGRRAIHGDKMLRALVDGASRTLGRRDGRSLAAEWLAALWAAASIAERAALRRLIERQWPGGTAPPALREAVRQLQDAPPRATPPPAEPGSPAWLLHLLRERPPGFQRLLRALLRSPTARARLAARLPERLLVETLAVAWPGRAAALLRAAELGGDALGAAGLTLSRAALWEGVLSAAAVDGGLGVLLDRLLAGARDGAASAVEADLARRARARGDALLVAVLEEREDARRSVPRRSRPAKPTPPAPADGAEQERHEAGVRATVANAGLVLAAPFLPQLFKTLDFLETSEDGGARWRSPEARDRAPHLLQYLVDGRCDRPEPVLTLNKLLCGQPLGAPTVARIDPTDKEIETCDSLLAAMLSHWPALSGSSVAALRETFLQRHGRISSVEDGWRLEVERKVLDVLLESIPWSFSKILHPWMTDMISVVW
jgi:hypothetical protein